MKLEAKPIKEQGRQLAVLVLLAGGLGYAVYTQFWSPAAGNASSSNRAVASTGAAPPVTPATMPTALKLSALEPVADGPAAGRNPFRFGEPPRPPAPVRTAPPPVALPPPGPPPPPPGPPPPPPITLKFVASMDLPGGAKVASLSDGKGVFLGREGDVIDGRYRIVRIGLESIVMEYVDGRGRQTIPLRGTEF